MLGAGAAGLAAAHELTSNGHSVLILEARDRIGGRILTDDSSTGSGAPVELGAEFIHGRSAAVFDWLRRAGDVPVDAGRERWVRDGGGAMRRAEPLFEELRRRLARIERPRADLTLCDFLERHRRALRPAVRSLACSLVEGFDAADPTRISAREVLEEWQGSASADAPTFRASRGFGAMIEAMRATLPPQRTRLQCGTVVRTVRWRRGSVEIEALRHDEPLVVTARRVIVTLPLGVLQQPDAARGAVRFEPELRARRTALARLAMGPVTKLVLQFDRPFWEQISHGRYRDAAFFFAPGAPFPTFWTSVPVRKPMLTAWSAGPNSVRLGGLEERDVLMHAVASLRLFGQRPYKAMLERFAWHDWQADPYA
ncbi:MAG TPA: NAD(P)/FAD-dependent oxidoreductase, partial [Steroidobacteraceae bacterium]